MNKRYQHFYKKQTNRRSEKGRTVGAKERKRRLIATGIFMISAFFVMLAVIYAFRYFYKQAHMEEEVVTTEEMIQVPPLSGVADQFSDLPITEEFLDVNQYSRPGIALSTNPEYVVIHYTANPGSTAEQNRNYFENLKDTGETYASAQFVIGLEGEIIQCVPCNEMAYCSNSLNDRCISIEMCHSDDTGNFNDATYNNCVYLVAQLMNYYHLDMDHLIRHYDVTGKNCPKYFVEHEDRWEVFKDFVQQYREKYENGEK
ncbi:MAG: peptidoglycan recognition family protein [Lachnospiraceae bacterium]|nr:peptidoglycan recognition family protein [Lachnospiraceae bacterium]